ncbi:helix-turn-helix domain-containing protein [Adlercreutzia sp. R7]|uniref:Helix-turn-helix domain-containing protein n=1 Tax=Adlercreutzia wanghongyangiae TaxID=3111451 RepID=A0ABU6IHX1_9ACTN|nr:helix-turn-helix domain-containing protein [Adlercreutzia sp. R7]
MASNGNTPYTVAEAAQVLGLSAQTIRAEIRAGRLAAARVGRKYLIPRNTIQRLVSGEEFEGVSSDVA